MLEFWMLFLIIAIVAVIVEIFVPTMFCINFAFAGIITAIVSIFWLGANLSTLFILFVVISLLSIIFIKPLLVKMLKKEDQADFNTQYIGKIVKSLEPISKTSGSVTIYDERWEARLQNEEEEIPANTDVKIVGNDSLILFVERV